MTISKRDLTVSGEEIMHHQGEQMTLQERFLTSDLALTRLSHRVIVTRETYLA